jgi:hypothetical protein
MSKPKLSNSRIAVTKLTDTFTARLCATDANFSSIYLYLSAEEVQTLIAELQATLVETNA